MLVLETGDLLRGDAAAATEVDYTVHGLVDNAITQIADGQLAAAEATLYTSAGTVVISSLTLVNTGAVSRAINLYLQPSGGTSRRLIPKDMTLGSGYALLYDGQRATILNTSGESVTGFGSHASSHEDGGSDEISVAGLSGELADNQPPKAHAASHADGESDALRLNALASPNGDVDLAESSLIDIGGLEFHSTNGYTISSGTCTLGAYLFAGILGEGAVDDDLDSIVGVNAGALLVLFPSSATSNITIKHGTGNIVTPDGLDYKIPFNSFVTLIYVSTSGSNKWRLLKQKDAAQVNLIRNPFGAMSQGTQENQYGASNLITSWVNQTYDTLTSSGGDISSAINTSGGTQQARSDYSEALVKGRVYKVAITLTLNSGQAPYIFIRNGDDSAWHENFVQLVAGVNTFTFKEDKGGSSGYLIVQNTAASNYSATFTLYEQTRACIAANAYCFDLWAKSSTTDIYRIVASDHFTDHKFFYGALSVPSAQNDYLAFINGDKDGAGWVEQFRGSTIVVQAKVISDTPSDIVLAFYDGSTRTDSSYHSGGGTAETLEFSLSVPNSATEAFFQLRHLNAAPGNAYITDFQISFGTYIGEGNYVPPPPHFVPFEVNVNSADYYSAGFSDVAETDFSVEVDAGLAIPSGYDMHVWTYCKDSGSSGDNSFFKIGSTRAIPFVIATASGHANDYYDQAAGFVEVIGGDASVQLNASGSGTLDAYLTYTGAYYK